MSEFGDFTTTVLHGDLSLGRWLKDVRHADSFMIWDKQDNRPFRAYLWHFVSGAVLHKLRLKK